MQGVAKYFAPGETDVRAFIAGNDVLLFSQDVPTAIAKIKAAIVAGKVSEKDLERSVKKILNAKYAAGLNNFKPVDVNNITADINKYTGNLNTQIAEEAVTVLNTSGKILLPKGAHVLYVAVNGELNNDAENKLNQHAGKVTKILLPKNGSAGTALAKLEGDYDVIVVGMHGMNLTPAGNYGLSAEQVKFLSTASSNKKVIFALMGNAYAMKLVPNAQTIIVGYEDNEWTQKAVINVITGEKLPGGTLPVTPNIPAAKNSMLRGGLKQ